MKRAGMKNEGEVLILNTANVPISDVYLYEASPILTRREHTMGMLDLISQKREPPAQCDETSRVSLHAFR